MLALGGSGAPGGAAFAFVNAAMDAADRFFRTLASRGPAAAYAQTSPEFQASMTQGAFAQTAARWGLRGYRGIEWSHWYPPDWTTAQLTGDVDLAGGGQVVARMRVVKDADGAWRLAALTFGPVR